MLTATFFMAAGFGRYRELVGGEKSSPADQAAGERMLPNS
jgi:hypothetical protein